MTGGHAAVRTWAGHELRRRWRSVVVLGLLAGVTAGLATSALAGARRTDTVYDRLHREARGADAVVFATQADIFDADWSAVLDAPEVAAGGTFALAPIQVRLPGEDPLDTFVLPPSGGFNVDTERPVMSEGRAPDPDRVDEVWINEDAAEEFDMAVGDTVHLDSYLDLEAFFGDFSGAERGPSFEATITGIGTVPTDFSWTPGSQLRVTRALLDQHPEIPRATNLVVRLSDGSDVDDLRRLVADEVAPRVPILDLVEAGDRVTTSTNVERDGLRLFALAVGAAGILIVGQAIVRSVQASAADGPTLSALGLERRDLALALALPTLPAAAVAGITTTVVAIALSPRYPIGLGRQLEPDPGVDVDVPLVVGVTVLTAVVVGAIAAVTAIATARHRVRTTATRAVSVTERAINTLTLPLPVAVGARFALTTGQGRTALPTRPALVGAIAAVLGVVAAFTLGAGIDDALANPDRVGTSWDASIYPAGDVAEPSAEQREAVEDDPAIAEESTSLQVVARLAGDPTPLFSLEPKQGSISYRLLEGRAPSEQDEIVLGPDTLAELDLAIGESVPAGLDDELDLEIVGTALLQQGVHWAYDQGGWLTAGGLRAVAATQPRANVFEHAYVRWADGTDEEAAAARLETAGLVTEEPELPQTLRNLKQVQSLPFLLAGFLVLLGVGAVGHSLVSAVRRRRHELAVLRSLGMTPRQAWASSAWQATCLAVVGALIGIPVGLVVGRTVWRLIAEAAPIYYVAPLALVVLILALPVALVTANALAALPGRASARERPAQILRAE